MAEKGIYVIDRVVQEQMGGGLGLDSDLWYIPQKPFNEMLNFKQR